jgi:ubiquitin-conjugating enzyme E2 W
MSRVSKRIVKEQERWSTDASLDGFELEVRNPQCWRINFSGAPSTLYSGERFTLEVTFPDEYPIESPVVVFVPPYVPVHPHIYSNGHICLNILGDDWSPALTIHSVCVSILSMLSSASKKELPHDNDRYVSRNVSNPKKTQFAYHDDSV